MCVVVVDGKPVFRYAEADWSARAMFIAQAQEAGYANARELAAALGSSERTMFRHKRRFLVEGAKGMVPKKPGPKGPRLGAAREAAIRRWTMEGRSANWMAQRLKISHQTVTNAMVRMNLRRQQAMVVEPELALSADEAAAPDLTEAAADAVIEVDCGGRTESAVDNTSDAVVVAADEDAAPAASGDEDRADVSGVALRQSGWQVGSTFDVDPTNRAMDRMLAAVGVLDDAAPLFAPATDVPRAGVLLALPGLVASGVFEVAEEVYGSIGPAFYGLRTVLLTMVLFALLRIKHPENVKEYSPADLGRVIGLDRVPEVKTIRRKLARLTTDGEQSERFIDALVRRRVERASEALGFLYVDGHVRVYHGRADLPKAHVARMRLSLPATQDVWVNDGNGDPVFVMTQHAHEPLVGALPPVLKQVRDVVGERRVTVVFDRGGWSPKLFERMHADGFDVMTYRKGNVEALPAEVFTSYVVELPTGPVTYELHDTLITVGSNGFGMRQVTRRRGEHQTQIVTTRHDLTVTEVARRMFDRWRQENFFKYMRQEFAIDALIEYATEPDDPDRLVPDPARRAVDRDLVDARREVARLEMEYGNACAAGQERASVRIPGFTPIYGMYLLKPLASARQRVTELESKRSQIPTRVRVGDIKDEVVRLPSGRKRLSDALKMLAYQIETDLTRAAVPHFARGRQEGRTLISAALQSAGDIDPVDGELRVTLAAQSTRSRSIALARLCRELNDTETLFPGTSLRLRYAIQGVEHDT